VAAVTSQDANIYTSTKGAFGDWRLRFKREAAVMAAISAADALEKIGESACK